MFCYKYTYDSDILIHTYNLMTFLGRLFIFNHICSFNKLSFSLKVVYGMEYFFYRKHLIASCNNI